MDFLADPYVPDVWRHPISPARVIAEGAGCLWMSVPMAFENYRLCGMGKAARKEEQDYSPWFGWCFRGELALMAALAVWDPVTEDEPLGWHKRTGEPRRAPEREKNPDYNTVRCVHGSYVLSLHCAVDEFCEETRMLAKLTKDSSVTGRSNRKSRQIPSGVTPQAESSSCRKEEHAMKAEDRIDAALAHLRTGVYFGEAHHMAWTLDQVVRLLTGCPEAQNEGYSELGESLEYRDFVKTWEEGENGPQTYRWDTGIAP